MLKIMVLTLFLLGSIACSSKTNKEIEQIKVVKEKAKIPLKPSCISIYLPVQFVKKYDLYCIDRENALNLIANIEEMKECIIEYEKWAKEVEEAVYGKNKANSK